MSVPSSTLPSPSLWKGNAAQIKQAAETTFLWVSNMFSLTTGHLKILLLCDILKEHFFPQRFYVLDFDSSITPDILQNDRLSSPVP